MINLASGGALEAAAWKIKNLQDFEARLERAARRSDEQSRTRATAALVIYESALMKSGRPANEVRELVSRFKETFEDEEEALTIPRVSRIMNVEGVEWFFGDEPLRVLTGQLLGQFQHRVAQYNYIDEREVLRRWADGYDTRLFIRRRIHETEPIVGVVESLNLRLMQYLRVAAGGDTVVPGPELARVLATLGVLSEGVEDDDYSVLGAAESLALHLEIPAPIVGEILVELAAQERLEFPEPPSDAAEAETGEAGAAGDEIGEGGTDRKSARPSPDERAKREAARREPDRGEEPTRVQDPQAKDAPGTSEEDGGERSNPVPPETGSADAPGKEGNGDSS